MKSVQYIPRATEKAYNAQTQNKYVFYVPKSASKQAIAKAIAEAFKVTVVDVQVLCRKGKATRFSRGKHAYPGITFITVKAGDKIPVFEEAKQADEKASKKAEKADKKTEKVEKKTTKKVAKKEEK